MNTEATNRCDCNCTVQQVWDSTVEKEILDSIGEPIEISEQSEPIEINGEFGIWANKHELRDWTGPIPIEKYPINQDPNPEIINKKPNDIDCKREVLIKYLEPTELPDPGKIIINQMANIPAPPAPPVIIRQIPAIPTDPEPLIIREAPPKIPVKPADKIITIPGEMMPPPPRKLVIEKLPELPTKPPDVILERWLPFKDQKRKIILNPKPEDPVQLIPKNIIVEWKRIECSSIKTDIKNLGVEKADPIKYAETYGNSLVYDYQMPEIVNEVKKKHDIQLAADTVNHKYYMELEGDLHALKLIDLDKEGLSEYKSYLENLTEKKQSLNNNNSPATIPMTTTTHSSFYTTPSPNSLVTNLTTITPEMNTIIEKLAENSKSDMSNASKINKHSESPSSKQHQQQQKENLKSSSSSTNNSENNNSIIRNISRECFTSQKIEQQQSSNASSTNAAAVGSEKKLVDKAILDHIKRSSVKFCENELYENQQQQQHQQQHQQHQQQQHRHEKINIKDDSGLNSEAINTSLIDIDQIEKDVNDIEKDNDKTEFENIKTETERLEDTQHLMGGSFDLPKFSISEIYELKQAFNLYDVAGNGFLRIQEIDSVLRSLGIFPSEQELQKMLNDIGASDDGNVSFEDFVSLMYAISIIAEIADDPVSESESKKNFSIYERSNNSRSSSSDILKSMLKSQRILVSEEEINGMLDTTEKSANDSSNMSERRENTNCNIDIADANKYCTF